MSKDSSLVVTTFLTSKPWAIVIFGLKSILILFNISSLTSRLMGYLVKSKSSFVLDSIYFFFPVFHFVKSNRENYFFIIHLLLFYGCKEFIYIIGI